MPDDWLLFAAVLCCCFLVVDFNGLVFLTLLSVWKTREAKDDNLEQELSLADKRNKREIRLLEGEIPLWQVIVEKLNAASKLEPQWRLGMRAAPLVARNYFMSLVSDTVVIF